MKNWGRLLLVAGFVWLVAESFLFPAVTTTLTSNAYDAISRRPETFTKQEVVTIVAKNYQRCADFSLWILPPACLMLIGGFLLDRVARKR